MPPASCYLLSAICFLHSASNSPLPALCTQRPVLHSCIKLSASSFLLSASCFLRTLPLPFTLYSLLTASALSALCPQLSAFRSLPFNIGTLRKMVFREVVSVGVRAGTLPHTEKNACGVRPHVAPPRYLSATSLPSLHPG